MTVVDGRRYYCSKSAQSNDRAGAIKPLLITAEERGSTSRVTGDIQYKLHRTRRQCQRCQHNNEAVHPL